MFAQDTLYWQNPSFEGPPVSSAVPDGWESHSFEGNTPPDTQPGSWGVNVPAQEGGTYISMVAKDNSTWEAVGQPLGDTLESGSVYRFSAYVCKAASLLSGGNNYNMPLVLRIWGGSYLQPFGQLLATTQAVYSLSWQKMEVEFMPLQAVDYIVLEAYYAPEYRLAYNGSLMLDNLSPIVSSTDRVVELAGEKKPHYAQRKRLDERYNYLSRPAPVNVQQPSRASKKRKKRRRKNNPSRKFQIEQAIARHEADKEQAAQREADREVVFTTTTSILDNRRNEQPSILKRLPSNAEATRIAPALRQPLIDIGPEVITRAYTVDRAILEELATLMTADAEHTLILAVRAPQQGARDKVAADLNWIRQELEIPESIITIEQYVGQNTYFKDWLWLPEGQRAMVRVVPRLR